VSEIAGFLAQHPPFDRLDESELERVVAASQTQEYEVGADALVEDGHPASAFYIVLAGSMELVHEEEVIDVLEPGEAFGHPSLLTGLAPAFTVRAHEPARCLLIPPELALEVLARPAGTRFVATSLRERMTRTGHMVHGLPELQTTPVSALVHRDPVFCPPGATLREAAQAMTDERVSAVLVDHGNGVGILTESDLREKVVAGPLSPDDPVGEAMTTKAVTVRADRLALDAMIDMLEAGFRHLPVVDGDRVLGVIAAESFLELESRSPFGLRRELAHARDEDELAEVASRLPRMFLALAEAGLAAPEIGKVLALQSDTATNRLIDLSIERRGPPPAAWAWLALGSVARRELTLASDQDNALAYDDVEGDVDAYFAAMGEDVDAGLARCGFGADAADVLARDRRWRMSASEWERTFRECFELPDRSHLVRAAVSFDFRHVSGGLEIVRPLVEILREAPSQQGFLRRLARTATDAKPPLGFRGKISTGNGSNGRIDVKRGGVVPAANLARFHALANGVTISATLDRLVAVEEIDGLPPETAQSLREAFAIVCKVRLDHHAALIRRGETPDNLVDPNELPPLARLDLREAFRAIAEAQKQLQRFVPLGM
jgi:CBS domain-containing protein